MLEIMNKKIVFFVSILIFFAFTNKSFARLEVSDVLWKTESIRSKRIADNKINDFCLLYKESDKSIYDKKSISINDVEYVGSKIYNFLKSKGIKVNTKYLNDTIEKAKISKQENLNFINNLKKQETENNYKNCDYLVVYYVWNGSETVVVTINIFDIRRNETTSDYLISKRYVNLFKIVYPKLEEFIDKGLNIWWKKYQE